MTRRPPCSAFTLVEMLVVMAVIAILTGLILSLNAVVQGNSARSRAYAEIKSMSAMCEQYKADNGGYPQGSPSTVTTPTGPTATDTLDPNPLCTSGANPSTFSTFDPYPLDYTNQSLFLWQQLSGQLTSTNAAAAPSGTNYGGDFFTPTRLSETTNGQIVTVAYIMDPFGNPYGYSTAGLYSDQQYRASVLATGTGTRMTAGYNPTFDLWSTGGATTAPVNSSNQITTTPWVKNW